MFRTELHIEAHPHLITHESNILSLGSCFSEIIGNRLQKGKINTSINPYGVIFNPISIFSLFGDYQPRIIESNGTFKDLSFHSDISGYDESELTQTITKTNSNFNTYLKKTDWIFLTFGTSIIYRYKKDNSIVANCHKLNRSEFTKEQLDVDHIINAYRKVADQFKDKNVLITVSPIRHIKEGIRENQLSKSVLRVTCSKLVQEYDNIHYFPGYEFMMDDLRDYRFYERDMLHPSDLARDYIFEKFCQAYISDDSINLLDQFSKIHRALDHRPFNPKTEQHQKFLKKLKSQIEALAPISSLENELQRWNELAQEADLL